MGLIATSRLPDLCGGSLSHRAAVFAAYLHSAPVTYALNSAQFVVRQLIKLLYYRILQTQQIPTSSLLSKLTPPSFGLINYSKHQTRCCLDPESLVPVLPVFSA